MAKPTPTTWLRRRVFVTGCTGLLGGWLTDWLARAGADVVGLVRGTGTGTNFLRMGLADRVTIVRGALEDYALLERTLNEYEIEVIFHVAAQAIVVKANADPVSTFSVNIGGTWNILEAARHAPRVKAVVLASSDKAYGTQAVLPYTEAAPLVGRGPYEVSKSCADLIGQAYWASYRLPIAITRCGNFYGGGDLNFNRIVPGTIRSLVDGQRPIIRSDGSLIRDYFYIKDAVNAYTMVAEKLLAGEALGEAYNFSNENQVTVKDLVSLVCELFGGPITEPIVLGEPVNEIAHQYLSAAKARSQLGWEPRYTLKDGLVETIAWYKDYLADHN